MTKATEDEYATLEEGAVDPIEPGEIKVIKGPILELDDCDADTQWSVHSGAGVTIIVDESNVYEGTGSIKVYVPAGITAIVKAVKSSGSWDLSSHKYLKTSVQSSSIVGSAPYPRFYFGEATYNEQQSDSFGLGTKWVQRSWDISGIAAADRNAVTIFAVSLPGGTSGRTFHIDYIFADPGPSQVKHFDGDRIIQFYPKIMTGHYHGTGSALTVTLNRKGTPSAILLIPLIDAKDSVAWQTEFGADSKNLQTSATIANGVTAVGDGSFTVGTNANINTSGERVSYIVMWDD